jgi:hypothetical protein
MFLVEASCDAMWTLYFGGRALTFDRSSTLVPGVSFYRPLPLPYFPDARLDKPCLVQAPSIRPYLPQRAGLTIEFIFDDPIAFTDNYFQTLMIEACDMTSGIKPKSCGWPAATAKTD